MSAPPLPPHVAALDAAARVVRTRCGAGTMTWRTWGAGPALVLAHGGAGSWTHWSRNLERLAADRSVWCPDLPTLGESGDPPVATDVGSIAEVVAAGLDELLPGPRAFDLVGFSFGALVSTLAVSRMPGRVRRLVLVGAASLGLPDPKLPLRAWRVAEPGDARRAVHAYNLSTLMLASPEPDVDTVSLHAFNVERARFDGRRVAGRPLLRDALPGLDVERVDAIYGARDAVIVPDVTAARDVLRACRPALRFTSIAGAGHWVQYEAPEAFEAALRAMLDAPR